MRAARIILLSLLALLATGIAGAAQGLEPHAPIAILSDADFTADNGVRSGSGTREDPYIISDWFINADQVNYCIRVENVTQIFRISDCVLTASSRYAIELIDVEHAEIVNSCISASLFGVLWNECSRCIIRNCSIDEIAWEAVSVLESSACEVIHCLFGKCGPAIWVSSGSMSNRFTDNVFLAAARIGARLEADSGGNLIARNDFHGMWSHSDSYNRWTDNDGRGNYWSRYTGTDQDGDGTGDSPYKIFGKSWETDSNPAMDPYHPEAEIEWDYCAFEEP